MYIGTHLSLVASGLASTSSKLLPKYVIDLSGRPPVTF